MSNFNQKAHQKALGYARVSLEKENIENQKLELTRFSQSMGLELLKIFEDIGVSGSKPALEREGFKQLLEASKLLNIKTIVVYDLTRLGRDLFDLVDTYKYLLENGFNVLFVKHPELNGSGSSPVSEAMRRGILTMLGVMAELERAFIIERTKAGLERAKKEGKKLGRRPIDLPLDKIKEYRKKGLTKKTIYQILVELGYLRYKTRKGEERVMSYDRFVKRLKKMGL